MLTNNEQLRELISSFLTDNLPVLQKRFKEMKLRDQVKLYRDLLKYGLPYLQPVKEGIDFSQLTEVQLDKIIDELRKTITHETEQKEKS